MLSLSWQTDAAGYPIPVLEARGAPVGDVDYDLEVRVRYGSREFLWSEDPPAFQLGETQVIDVALDRYAEGIVARGGFAAVHARLTAYAANGATITNAMSPVVWLRRDDSGAWVWVDEEQRNATNDPRTRDWVEVIETPSGEVTVANVDGPVPFRFVAGGVE